MKKILYTIILSAFSYTYGSSLPSTPDIVVFDFGGVVGETNYEGLAKQVRKELMLPRSEEKKLASRLRKLHKGKIKAFGFWQKYQSKGCREIPVGWEQRYQQMHTNALRIRPEMAKIIKDLKKQGCKVALLSNVGGGRAKEIQNLGLYKPFKPAVLSCDINVEKPHLKAYKILLKKLGDVSPERCFFIDDKQENVDAAMLLGIRAVKFTSPTRLRWDLQIRNILPPGKLKGS